MNASGGSGQDIFDVRKIRRLVELMKEHDLTEVDLQEGELRIQLRRGAAPVQPVLVAAPAAPAPAVPSVPLPSPPGGASAASAAAGPKAADTLLIKSPMVGTFYSAPDPESPPFVKVGDPIGPETVVCIVEAMKVFNQIPAEVSGRIVAVLVENGAPVEFGQPLFRVDRGV
jgi:acetyl-CoA carboxylase biotin carboxyl carrier protein